MRKGFEGCRGAVLRVWHSHEDGIATLISLIALSVFSLLACYLLVNATTEVRISDNYESQVQAGFAARAGLNHARELLRGLAHNDLLRGPDGTYSTGDVAAARPASFRNLLSWNTARSLDIVSPGSAIPAGDDGIISTGKHGTTNGTPLIPAAGITQTCANPYGSGTIITSRYFVKVSDNNGEASELAADAGNNPFIDGDGLVIVRSIGVARTIREGSGNNIRRNSVAAVEARFHSRTTFSLDAPLVVEGNTILPSHPNMFDGNSFNIVGGSTNPGIAVIDTVPGDTTLPYDQIYSGLSSAQRNRITGEGLNPSIQDITSEMSANEDKQLLLQSNYLYNFVNSIVPQFADAVYQGNQSWAGNTAPDLGYYDPTRPPNDPVQRARVTVVNGDLSVSGNMSGGGLLVVRGKFWGSGRFVWNGLILVIGAGDVDMSGMNIGITGGMFVVNVQESNGVTTFGTPKLTISGNSDIVINSSALDMAVRLIPADQLGWREVTSVTDP